MTGSSCATLTDTERKRLASILGLLGSNHAGERDAAALHAEAFRRKHRLTWAELLALPPIDVAPPSPPTPPPSPQPERPVWVPPKPAARPPPSVSLREPWIAQFGLRPALLPVWGAAWIAIFAGMFWAAKSMPALELCLYTATGVMIMITISPCWSDRRSIFTTAKPAHSG